LIFDPARGQALHIEQVFTAKRTPASGPAFFPAAMRHQPTPFDRARSQSRR